MDKIKNEIMLITYADSLGENLKDLKDIIDTYYSKAVGGVHILPFFPSSGDRGFAPMRYDVVDEAFGDMNDVKSISENKYLMYDFMVNHISRQSDYFKDFTEKKDESEYKDFFIRYKDFWKNGEPTQEEVDLIYKRKPRAPYYEVEFKDGSKEKVWCTFAEEQIDLNMDSKVARDFIKETLINMCKNGASIIRLDAFAYAIKKPGTSCFFIEPEMWELLYEIQGIVKAYGVDILPEIHEHYTIQHKIAEKGFWIYDFALPVLVLDVKDLMTDEEIHETKEAMFTKGANVKKIYNTAAYNNLDIYQVNCTYYSALGNNDKAYLLARAIQFFAPGIPQVYYVGMLAGENDIELMESTKNGRDINRHYYTKEEIKENIENRKVVRDIRELMELRNSHKAFGLDGECITETHGSDLIITRKCGEYSLTLKADLKSYDFTIE
ncbi:MAG: sucrose phosphorylase [Clostridium sp.]|uniref:sucrose phosphorylase n=1 Tax=Clostridium sp. TaxID=1506 RepID=UPI00257A4529|nr:sucrose phosphorylase [Clostridium sp.]MBS4842865.1 sucrose phosphorylase [Clostridium sp.]